MKREYNIVGISAHYHDSACCLFRGTTIVAAAEEERFSRLKHDRRIPSEAFKYCLSAGEIGIDDVDCVAFYEKPATKLSRQISMVMQSDYQYREALALLDPMRSETDIRERLGYAGLIKYYPHHQSHAASAFYLSGFDDAAILTVDGVGEWATTTYGYGVGPSIEVLEHVEFPDSLGLLYGAITQYLGFEVNEGEYKVMGLASYGKPIYRDKVRKLISSSHMGQYRLDMTYFDFISPDKMCSEKLFTLFGKPAREPHETLNEYHADLASSAQAVIEELLLDKVRYLHLITGSDNLCMAGGVALNCVANGRIAREGPFRRMFVQPAPGDSGGCLGAGALAVLDIAEAPGTFSRLEHVSLGPRYSQEEIEHLIESAGIAMTNHAECEKSLVSAVVDRLVDGKVVAWFQGRMEFGPRALGCRSILADPRSAVMRDRINSIVKKREVFRPFAPAVLESRVHEHFEMDHPSPFMTEVCRVKSPLNLPAITHVDGSARVQTVNSASNPRFAALLEEFDARTGCPILLNTSFNMKHEPIVCNPADALICFARSEIDVLVVEDCLIDRENLPAVYEQVLRGIEFTHNTVINHRTYTFL